MPAQYSALRPVQIVCNSDNFASITTLERLLQFIFPLIILLCFFYPLPMPMLYINKIFPHYILSFLHLTIMFKNSYIVVLLNSWDKIMSIDKKKTSRLFDNIFLPMCERLLYLCWQYSICLNNFPCQRFFSCQSIFKIFLFLSQLAFRFLFFL